MSTPRKTLFSRLDELAERTPDARLLGEGGAWLTASQVCRQARNTAQTLLNAGIGPGALVAVCAEQRVRTAVWLLALDALGAVALLCDPREDVRAASSAFPVQAWLSGGMCAFPDGTQLSLEPSLPGIAAFQPLSSDPLRPAFVLFTSGSTGTQKAVMLSGDALIRNMEDAMALGDYRPGDVALGVLPLTHVFGLVLLVGAVVAPYALCFLASKDFGLMAETIRREGVTRMNGVPSMYLGLCRALNGQQLSTLRCGFIGGGPCAPEQFDDIERALHITLIPAYGMSECIGISSASWQDPAALRRSGVGRFYASTRGVILLEDGGEAAPGQVGEICVDSLTRMLGYYGQTEAQPSLLRTGDLGYADEHGVLHLAGRRKDIIIRNGVNLSARAIEQALLSVPGVSEAAVVALADETAGEAPGALIVSEADEVSVLSALTRLLHKNELPALLLRVPCLPLTASGKTDKKAALEVLLKWRKA